MKQLQIINALLWATAILVTAYFFRDAAGYEYVLGTQLVAAGLMLSLIRGIQRKQACN